MIRITGPLAGKRILLLQGPNGNFFRRLDNFFRQHGARTHRICFNAADRFYANKDNRIDFKARPEAWPDFLQRTLAALGIDSLYLFGDCRPYHQAALAVAAEAEIEAFVFEEGYLRPDFITLERSGANAFSRLPRAKAFYASLDLKRLPRTPVLAAETSTAKMYWQTSVYYLLNRLCAWRYPHYRHHRGTSVVKEGFYGLRSGLRKLRYRLSESGYNAKFEQHWRHGYFFVPLQTYCDAQLRVHSDFDSMEAFIDTVLTSFARHAPAACRLVFKHHPVDRGAREYSRFIRRRARALGVAGRVLSLHDVHLPTCLKHACGTITINSTVGLSALFHQTPTLVLGEAVYDVEGLTCKGMPLDRFWWDARRPDPLLYQKFRRYLIQQTQLNGSFYGRFPARFPAPAGDQKVLRLAPEPAPGRCTHRGWGALARAWWEHIPIISTK